MRYARRMRQMIFIVGGLVAAPLLQGCDEGSGPSGCTIYCETFDVVAEGVPKFVDESFMDLGPVLQISRFRSGAGHSYEDRFEACRSMKHYFDTGVSSAGGYEIVSPVEGVVVLIGQEPGKLELQSAAQPAFYFQFFHVDLDAGIEEGTTLDAGQRIGTSSLPGSEIAVGVIMPEDGPNKSEISGTDRWKLVSWFDVLTDAAFAEYEARGLASRDEFIISESERDAAPLNCDAQGEFLTEEEVSPTGERSSAGIANWVQLVPSGA